MTNTFTNGKIKLFRSGLQKENSGQIVIGGPDLSDLPSKQALLEQQVEEASISARENADEIIKAAEAEASRIIAKAQENAENIHNQAQEEGFNAGYKDALEKVNEEFAKYIIESAKILEAIKQEREECLEDEEHRVHKIILELAKQIFKKDFVISEEITLKYIKTCISNLEHRSTVNILVNSELATKLNQVKNDILNQCPGLENLSITASSNMEFGDMILESNKERLDYRIDSIFEKLLKETLG